jgi:dipeptidyl aminopeptidase/acylaminoacyl peptidase
MKRRRIFLRWSLIVAAVWLVVSAGIGLMLVEGALHSRLRVPGAADEAQAQALAARHHAVLADVAVIADDGVTLRGWSIRPLHGNGDAVILLHGQTDDRMGMMGNAELLLGKGYAVLLPDARGHGASGGELTTFGVKEARDVRHWFDRLQQAETPRCIDGLGDSMGAVELLQSLATTPGFCAVVAESPFASFRAASYDRLGKMLGAGAWTGRTLMRPAVEAGMVYARCRYGVDLEQSSPQNAVAASNVPVLLIHGKKDVNLLPVNSEKIVALNPAVALWEPAEAAHCGAYGAQPEEYKRRLLGWFASHDRAAAAGR